MSERLLIQREKLSDDYKKRMRRFSNDLFIKALGVPHPDGKKITFNMVNNWMFGRNGNVFLDRLFIELMSEIDPEGVEKDLNR